MKRLTTFVAIAAGLALATPLRAHRTTGLLQASLVEVQPTRVEVEVTLSPGTDIAPKMVALLDRDGDGSLSRMEADAWASDFLKKQRVALDGHPVPLAFQAIQVTPLSEMGGGHSQITVHFAAQLGDLPDGPHTLVVANRYEPFESAYQCNGLVPKSSAVRIAGHQRAEAQRELTLTAEFSGRGSRPEATPSGRRSAFIPWILGLGFLGMVAGGVLFDRTFRKAI